MIKCFARTVLFMSCAGVFAAAALAEGPRIDPQTSGARRAQPAGGASGETAGAMQGPMAPDRNAVEVAPAGMQPYLTDRQGRALYLLEGESKDKVACGGPCGEIWPPLLDREALGAQARSELIGTRKRADGSRQVTYNGHPLYYYAKDRGQGRATGQDVHDRWGEWYLVTPQGGKVKR